MVARLSAPETAPPTRRAADHLVEHLVAAGVDRVFGIPGGAISPVFDALRASPIEVVICQHEGMASYMAYGYAKATGRPGVIAVTAGPGLLNAIPGIAAAFHDEVPLVVLAGDVRTDFAGRGVIQDGGPTGLDVRTMLAPVTRFADRLSQPGRMQALLTHAFDRATRHPMGPALLELPVDQCGAATPSLPAWRIPVDHQELDLDALARAAQLLSSARRVAVLVGLGAARRGVGAQIDRLVSKLRAPVLVDLEGRGVVPDSAALNLGAVGIGGSAAAARFLDDGVDVLLTIGARLDDTTTQGYGDALVPSQALIQLDHDAMRLGRAYPADIAVHGDLGHAVDALVARVRAPGVALLLERDAAIRSARRAPSAPAASSDTALHDPRAVIEALQRAFGHDTRFTSDIGNHLLFAAAHLRVERPGGLEVSLGLGGMGSGIGCAMGMAAAGHAERVVGICGDGGLMMVGNELATCARYGIPLVLAVLDNRQLGMVQHGMERHYGDVACCDVPDVDIVAYASSLGAAAVTVTDLSQLAELAATPVAGPLVLHLPIDPDVRARNPRERGFETEARAVAGA